MNHTEEMCSALRNKETVKFVTNKNKHPVWGDNGSNWQTLIRMDGAVVYSIRKL